MIIAANFKSNKTRSTTRTYLEELNHFVEQSKQEVYVFPPATALDSFEGRVNVGAQNAFAVENGAFTGEIANEQLAEFGIDTILIGHSERRHVLNETQEEVAEKFNFYRERNFTIVYCIGETLEIRESGNDTLMKYLEDQLEGIDLGYEKLIIAYEPVWAIGTGLTPTLNDIELIHSALKQKIEKPILYGGSVKAANAREILALESVDGILVGSGALDVNDFISMIKDADSLRKE